MYNMYNSRWLQLLVYINSNQV